MLGAARTARMPRGQGRGRDKINLASVSPAPPRRLAPILDVLPLRKIPRRNDKTRTRTNVGRGWPPAVAHDQRDRPAGG